MTKLLIRNKKVNNHSHHASLNFLFRYGMQEDIWLATVTTSRIRKTGNIELNVYSKYVEK